MAFKNKKLEKVFQLAKPLEIDLNSTTSLILRRSRDEHVSWTCWQNYVAKVARTDEIVGGYNPLAWDKIKDWVEYYRQPYVLASSLNLKINPEILASSENNTNVAEVAHSLANRRRIDQKALKIIDTQNKFGVPYSRCDNGEIKSITRKEKFWKRRCNKYHQRRFKEKRKQIQLRILKNVKMRKAIAEAEALEIANLEREKKN
ncbi:hypothetical protein Glove_433g22 [Diversispora epigaea]|uniref:Uncharacterized protein n=1 Tax=Diversispora epigaea TaxID=1348612 RepID=A0A397GSA9_9GLOM|nr:hypothetical protein Glove_433g22 [Diversispora epigaea]